MYYWIFLGNLTGLNNIELQILTIVMWELKYTQSIQNMESTFENWCLTPILSAFYTIKLWMYSTLIAICYHPVTKHSCSLQIIFIPNIHIFANLVLEYWQYKFRTPYVVIFQLWEDRKLTDRYFRHFSEYRIFCIRYKLHVLLITLSKGFSKNQWKYIQYKVHYNSSIDKFRYVERTLSFIDNAFSHVSSTQLTRQLVASCRVCETRVLLQRLRND